MRLITMTKKKLTLLYVPDPRLKLRSSPVECVDRAVQEIFDAMLYEMAHHDGLGFAAPQFNIQKRLIVVNCGPEYQPQPLVMANPQITWASDEVVSFPEGCFSVPLQYGNVTRPKSITVRYLDYDNNPREMTCHDLLADCIQHEIDHLDGITFVDHQSPLKRKILLAKALKIAKQKSRQADHAPIL